jgi:hypothetical protein
VAVIDHPAAERCNGHETGPPPAEPGRQRGLDHDSGDRCQPDFMVLHLFIFAVLQGWPSQRAVRVSQGGEQVSDPIGEASFARNTTPASPGGCSRSHHSAARLHRLGRDANTRTGSSRSRRSSDHLPEGRRLGPDAASPPQAAGRHEVLLTAGPDLPGL